MDKPGSNLVGFALCSRSWNSPGVPSLELLVKTAGMERTCLYVVGRSHQIPFSATAAGCAASSSSISDLQFSQRSHSFGNRPVRVPRNPYLLLHSENDLSGTHMVRSCRPHCECRVESYLSWRPLPDRRGSWSHSRTGLA